ncbi:hypothetical protein [Brachybacterium tyrofermentans]|uniref:hypothetical protein n=1 Tax=Brachybacterium tyrofermentans TaxID=47848 RepID=UPI003FD1F99A
MSTDLATNLGLLAGVFVLATFAAAALYAVSLRKGQPLPLITVVGPALLAGGLGVLALLLS